MSFKEFLPIEDKSWLGIGKHLGTIVQARLESCGKTKADLAQYLELPPQIIDDSFAPNEPYICEYIESYSFGVFFPVIQDFLEIPSQSIFPTICIQNKQNLQINA
jgi:hypothetical protein